MHPGNPRIRVGLLLAFLWICLTIVFFLGLSVAIFREPQFSLNLGMIRTTGRVGLWITLVPALAGLAGVILWRQMKLGAQILTAYCLFWSVVILAGLPSVWNAKQSFCFKSFCITTPWVARLTLFALALLFVFAAASTRRTAFVPEKRIKKTLAPV